MLSEQQLLEAIPAALAATDLPGLGVKQAGKVRDTYRCGDTLTLVTTDRISAFDRALGLIPYKGQVLNQLSAWWFAQTSDIIGNHVLRVPDPNVTIAQVAEPLPIEVIVRGYITGVTSTSLWTLYAQGERRPYGLELPDGLRKNDPLPTPLVTPTTKAAAGAHDQRLTREEIVTGGLLSAAQWRQVEAAALALFARGQALARQAGLALVDTKYEFGWLNGRLLLIDELHTPDSSRYWLAEQAGRVPQPEHYDKEFLRLWYVAQGYRGEGEPPALPPPVAAQVAARYIGTYERLTGRAFTPGAQPAAARIARALAQS